MLKYFEQHKTGLIYIPLIIYWLILLTATSIPSEDLPPLLEVSDKVKHLVAYCGLAILLNLTLLYQDKYKILKVNNIFFTILIVFLYGLLDEYHQLFIPGRYFEWADLAADCTGATIGVILTWLIKNKSAKKHNTSKNQFK